MSELKKGAARAGHTSGEAQDTAASQSLCAVSSLPQDDLCVKGSGGDCSPRRLVRWATHTGQDLSDLDSAGSPVVLDYLRAVLPATPETWRGLDVWLGERSPRACGWHGFYDCSASVLDGGLVAWCSDDDWAERQGVVVDLPGRACAALGDQLVPFLSWCCDVGKVRRIDVAVDDRRGLVTFERIRDAHLAGGLVSKAKTCKWVIEHDTRTAERLGWSFYVGTRQSAAMVRIYDKAAERRSKGVDIDGSWVRVELEAHKDYADSLAREILARGGVAGVEQIAAKLRFCDPSETDSNRWRWDLAIWWSDFLGGVEAGGSLACGEKQVATVDSMERYLLRQVAPTLAALDLVHGDDTSWIVRLFESGDGRLRPKHWAAIELAARRAS